MDEKSTKVSTGVFRDAAWRCSEPSTLGLSTSAKRSQVSAGAAPSSTTPARCQTRSFVAGVARRAAPRARSASAPDASDTSARSTTTVAPVSRASAARSAASAGLGARRDARTSVAALPPAEASEYMRRCVASGLWDPNGGGAEA